MEQLLADHSKRHDYWLVYIDQQVKLVENSQDAPKQARSVVECRSVFERSIGQKWSNKQLKVIFQRWLAFEKAFGTDQSRTAVKQRAAEAINARG